jgi:hypothetical protein
MFFAIFAQAPSEILCIKTNKIAERKQWAESMENHCFFFSFSQRSLSIFPNPSVHSAQNA